MYMYIHTHMHTHTHTHTHTVCRSLLNTMSVTNEMTRKIGARLAHARQNPITSPGSDQQQDLNNSSQFRLIATHQPLVYSTWVREMATRPAAATTSSAIVRSGRGWVGGAQLDHTIDYIIYDHTRSHYLLRHYDHNNFSPIACKSFSFLKVLLPSPIKLWNSLPTLIKFKSLHSLSHSPLQIYGHRCISFSV